MDACLYFETYNIPAHENDRFFLRDFILLLNPLLLAFRSTTGLPMRRMRHPVRSHLLFCQYAITNANPCQCNTVTYSLMSACGACQGRTYLAWSVWSANCVMVYTDTYPEPLPSGVSVPGWAYLNVEAKDNFDQINARNNANLTASTALPSPTSSNVTSSKSSTLNKATSFTEPSFSSFSSAKANALGGGIVGGLFGISILFGLLYWYFHHRRKINRNGQQLASPTTSTHTSWPVQGQGPYMTQVAHTPAMPSSVSFDIQTYRRAD
ncbi:hypothetical protein BDN70DRAFT_280485 [Pholiota conissans]|uniref:Transmembrane protein n=1 Tax=Pholiota conissans TaxID=109636 RepID=A0A9P5YUW5_9AGAR|nr:hypothetical protein BDN70DRAFT_280485 [Pholiota conissans]